MTPTRRDDRGVHQVDGLIQKLRDLSVSCRTPQNQSVWTSVSASDDIAAVNAYVRPFSTATATREEEAVVSHHTSEAIKVRGDG